MIDPVEIGGVRPVEIEWPGREQGGETTETSFSDLLSGAIRSVDGSIRESEQNVQDLVSGKTENVHDVMISMQRAQVSFQMMVEVRNRMVDAYQELSRMQI